MRARFRIDVLEDLVRGYGGTNGDGSHDRHQVINFLIGQESQEKELVSQFIK
jgi:hypothetical protein